MICPMKRWSMYGDSRCKNLRQTIFSFKKFKDSIDRYKVWVIAYTKQLRAPMMFYTAAINGVFAALIAGALIFTQGAALRRISCWI